MMSDNTPKTARIYRMVMDKHVCPYGVKSKWLLERNGYTVEDHWLTTREQTDAFKREHDVPTTPQTFIGGKRIGGYTELRAFFGKPLPEEGSTSYRPVIAVFATAAALAENLPKASHTFAAATSLPRKTTVSMKAFDSYFSVRLTTVRSSE